MVPPDDDLIVTLVRVNNKLNPDGLFFLYKISAGSAFVSDWIFPIYA
jgi:hypothetical protein